MTIIVVIHSGGAIKIFIYLALTLLRSWAFGWTNDLSLEAKVGQLMMIGVPDQKITPATRLLLAHLRPGGVILFKRNISSLRQISELNWELQDISRMSQAPPLLIALDQEGGRVARIPITPPVPSPLALGKTRNANLVESVAFETGLILHRLGFNMNLAPVLDVISSEHPSFIGDRSFGAQASEVQGLGVAFAQGLLRAHILPTAKHFPGSGDLSADPHLQLSSSSSSVATPSFLFPFKSFSEVFPSAMMLSHGIYPKLDSSRSPATFSSHITQGLLRGGFHYSGLIITDDLLMAGAKVFRNTGEAAIAALKAGADILMLTWSRKDQLLVQQAILQAVRTGELSRLSIDEKVRRILKVKALLQTPLQRRHPAGQILNVESPKLARLENQVLDLNLEQELPKISSLADAHWTVMGSAPQFRWHFERGLQRPVGYLELSSKASTQNLIQKIQNDKGSIFLIPVSSKRMALWLSSLPSKVQKNIVAVNIGPPGYLTEKHFAAVLNFYHSHPNLALRLGERLFERASLVRNE